MEAIVCFDQVFFVGIESFSSWCMCVPGCRGEDEGDWEGLRHEDPQQVGDAEESRGNARTRMHTGAQAAWCWRQHIMFVVLSARYQLYP